ncbi:PhzF family phenazine biosynthesis protein [Silvimonas soli]|uniref:PhzF family phenazine biosynthesis protein n=1 Tax=Silvimonas soli TaxID=2980100 RepID=UPI0024B38542|nr:PhzF family phenazine biosynthesis protein [Silvimonas soli]
MAGYTYRIVNVFAETAWSGNPLAVFEDARGLEDADMQLLAQQLNLSETTFVFPSDQADARVRIFTPGYELPFAGHPTLGTGWVLAQTTGKTEVTLATNAGIIPVSADGPRMRLNANAPTYRDAVPAPLLAAALGLETAAIAGTARFVDTGAEQLVIPLKDAASVHGCNPPLDLFKQVATNALGRTSALVWAHDGEAIVARFFWIQGGSIGEDFGTGSACANLGGWFLAENVALPFETTMIQGHGINRLAHLTLQIDEDKQIQVGGRVAEVGRGEFSWPERSASALA